MNPENLDQEQFVKLISRARNGDNEATGELMSEYRDYLLLIANQELDPTIQAKLGPSDIVQQSMIAAHGYIAQFRGDTELEFRAWLRQILKNDLLDANRKFKTTKQRQVGLEKRIDDSRQINMPLQAQFNTPGTDALLNEQSKLIQQSISQLSEQYQTVLQLRNWQELSFPEIGIQMNCSADAARKLWYRAVVRLEKEFIRLNPGQESSWIQSLSDQGDVDES